jgi:hypothetical protein
MKAPLWKRASSALSASWAAFFVGKPFLLWKRRLPVAGSGAEKNHPQPLPCRRVPPLTAAPASA